MSKTDITHPFFLQVHEFLISQLQQIPEITDQNQSLIELIEKNMLTPPNFEWGQAAFACHSLAKVLRKAPQTIAQEIAQAFQIQKYSFISEAVALTGYINFQCNFESYATYLKEAFFETKDFFYKNRLPVEKRERINVEFSQPNTHKALHVGHLRNMIYGQAVCCLLEHIGHTVERVTYPGDLGAHIAKTLWYLDTVVKFKGELPKGVTDAAEWLGDQYAAADAHTKSPENATAERQQQIKEAISQVLQDIEEERGHLYPIYQKTRQWSLQQMHSIYDWLHIHFDTWYYESECDRPSRELMIQLANEGRLEQSQGAWGIPLANYGHPELGFALLLKSDGCGLYLTKDVELLRRKFQDSKATRLIVIVDARQKLHFKQLFKCAEILGYPQAAQSLHLAYENVLTEDGKPFSSRSLRGTQLKTLRNDMEKQVLDNYLSQSKNNGIFTDQQKQQCAQDVALGALKFGFLKVDAQTPIRFILKDWLRLDGDTGPYIQYTHARCNSVLDNVGSWDKTLPQPWHDTSWIEKKLLFLIGKTPEIIYQAATEYRPSLLTAHLLECCWEFNRFYKEHPIKSAALETQHLRLMLVHMMRETLRYSLSLLGIQAPNRM